MIPRKLGSAAAFVKRQSGQRVVGAARMSTTGAADLPRESFQFRGRNRAEDRGLRVRNAVAARPPLL